MEEAKRLAAFKAANNPDDALTISITNMMNERVIDMKANREREARTAQSPPTPAAQAPTTPAGGCRHYGTLQLSIWRTSTNQQFVDEVHTNSNRWSGSSAAINKYSSLFCASHLPIIAPSCKYKIKFQGKLIFYDLILFYI